MSVERAIHKRWSTRSSLMSLVPRERFFTGTARDNPELPFVVLESQQSRPNTRTAGQMELEEQDVRFSVFARSLEEALKIAAAIKGGYNRTSFLLDRGSCLCMQRVNHSWISEADGAWHGMSDYRCLIEQPVGE